MIGSLGDFNVSTVLDFIFTTVDADGVPTDLASEVVSVYKNNSDTPSTAGVTLTAPFDGVTGMNHLRIDTSADGTFYAAGSIFHAVLTAGTVDGASVVGYVVGVFSIEKTSALRPTVAGRTLDVTATGAAGVDWGNVENPTTANNLSATNIDTDQVVASVTGAVGSVTGAVGSVTGNVGGNVTGSVGSVAAGGITASSIADNAIDAGAIADGAIDAATFAAGAINAAAIANGAIDAATFAAGAIDAAAIATGAIDADALAADAVDEIWDEVMEGTTTARQSVRLANAANGGKLSGAATTNVKIRDVDDSKDRVDATVDADGNRTAVTLDLT